MRKLFSIVFFAFFLFAGMQVFASDVDIGQTEQQEITIEPTKAINGINLLDRATGHVYFISVIGDALQPEMERLWPIIQNRITYTNTQNNQYKLSGMFLNINDKPDEYINFT